MYACPADLIRSRAPSARPGCSPRERPACFPIPPGQEATALTVRQQGQALTLMSVCGKQTDFPTPC